MSQEMGRYPIESSSGDAFSIEGIGTYAAVTRPGTPDDIIVSLDPLNVGNLSDVVTLSGYQNIFGLAGWRGQLFAFDESGAVLQINLQTRDVRVLSNNGQQWWGAGVSSVLFSAPSDL